MTMTRFRQLPMLCVTGDTRCRIMYDTCARRQRSHVRPPQGMHGHSCRHAAAWLMQAKLRDDELSNRTEAPQRQGRACMQSCMQSWL